MEYWNDKESPAEGPNQENGHSGEKGQNQSSQQGPNYNCAIVINGKEIAHVDVSNVDEVQKLVHTLARKRKTSKDFGAESKASLSQTPEGSRHGSVEYQPLAPQPVQHNIQENYADEGTHQIPRETLQFFGTGNEGAKRHQPQTNPYPNFPQNPATDLTPDQPFFSYRNSNRLPSAISGNYFQPSSRVESFQYWKQQSQPPQQQPPQQQQQYPNPQFPPQMPDKRRHSMPTLPRYYGEFSPQPQLQPNPSPNPNPSKFTNPPYPIQKDLQKETMQQQYQNYLLQQQQQQHQQRSSFEDEFTGNYSHLQQQPQQQAYHNYQGMYNSSMFPSMPNYQSSFGAMQKPVPNPNQNWPMPLYDRPSKPTPIAPPTPTAMPDFPQTRPLPPDSRRNSTSSIDVRSRNAVPPNGKSKDSEQKRRNRINDRLTDLKDLLPEFTDHPEKTATKEEILSETIRYIRLLESECVELTEAITEKQRIRNIASSYGMMGGEVPKEMDPYLRRHPVEDDSS